MGKEELLQVELERSGGQLGLPRMFSIDVKSLTAENRAVLEQMIVKTDFFNLSGSYSKTGKPDTFEYRLTILSSKRKHSIIFHDQDGHPQALDDLDEWIRSHQVE